MTHRLLTAEGEMHDEEVHPGLSPLFVSCNGRQDHDVADDDEDQEDDEKADLSSLRKHGDKSLVR